MKLRQDLPKAPELQVLHGRFKIIHGIKCLVMHLIALFWKIILHLLYEIKEIKENVFLKEKSVSSSMTSQLKNKTPRCIICIGSFAIRTVMSALQTKLNIPHQNHQNVFPSQMLYQ